MNSDKVVGGHILGSDSSSDSGSNSSSKSGSVVPNASDGFSVYHCLNSKKVFSESVCQLANLQVSSRFHKAELLLTACKSFRLSLSLRNTEASEADPELQNLKIVEGY